MTQDTDEGTATTDADKWSDISERLRKRGRSARWEGLAYIYMMVLLVAAVVWFFSLGPDRYLPPGPFTREMSLALSVKFYSDPTAQVMSQVGQWVLKVGAVFLAVYLTQIVVGFARYQFRMYHLLNDCADSIDLAEGDVEKLAIIRSALSTEAVDFGKMPQTQIDKAMDVIKAVATAATKQGKD